MYCRNGPNILLFLHLASFNKRLYLSFSVSLEKKMDAIFCNSQRNDTLPPKGKCRIHELFNVWSSGSVVYNVKEHVQFCSFAVR